MRSFLDRRRSPYLSFELTSASWEAIRSVFATVFIGSLAALLLWWQPLDAVEKHEEGKIAISWSVDRLEQRIHPGASTYVTEGFTNHGTDKLTGVELKIDEHLNRFLELSRVLPTVVRPGEQKSFKVRFSADPKYETAGALSGFLRLEAIVKNASVEIASLPVRFVVDPNVEVYFDDLADAIKGNASEVAAQYFVPAERDRVRAILKGRTSLERSELADRFLSAKLINGTDSVLVYGAVFRVDSDRVVPVDFTLVRGPDLGWLISTW